jgi:nitrous oxidase accessory protein NosD
MADDELTENSEDLIVSNCRFSGKAYSAVSGDINGSDDSSLFFKKPARRIHIINNSFAGYVSPLYFHSIEEVIVRNNFFQDSFYDAIRLRQRVKKVIIESNQFKNIGTSKQVVSRDAIDTYWSGVELIIRANILEDISALGFDIKGVDPDGLYKNSYINVSDNIIKKTGYSAILVSSAQKPVKGPWSHVGPVVIRGNLIENAHTINEQVNNAAIWFRHGVADGIISGNVIKNSFGHAIGVNNFEKKAPINENIVVTQNIINGCSSGIYLHKVNGKVVKDNIIKNCKKETQKD